MDIQWIILARGCRLNADRTVDILGIGHVFNVPDASSLLNVHLVAKASFEPQETSEYKTVRLRVEHMQRKQVIHSLDLPYRVPDLATASSSTTYLDLFLDGIVLPYSGKYVFTLHVDGEYKNQELVEVRYT